MLNTNEKLNMAIFNPTNKDPYKISGANLPMPGAWATLIQWREAGFKVRKGEHPTRIDWTTNRGESRHYNVFHVTQCDPFDDNAVETNARIMELEEAARIAEAMDELAEPEIEAGNPEPEIVDQEVPEIVPEVKPEIPEIKALIGNHKRGLITADELLAEIAEVLFDFDPTEILYGASEITTQKWREIARKSETAYPVENARKPEAKPEMEKPEMKLRKGGYYIHGRFPNGVHWLDGYLFDYAGYTFGIAKWQGKWVVTETGTGMAVTNGETSRKKGMEQFEANAEKLVKIITEKYDTDKNALKAREAIANAYADAAQGGR